MILLDTDHVSVLRMTPGGDRRTRLIARLALAVDDRICIPIVVTEETMTDSEKRPKIPGVCKTRRIECINLLEFMRRQKWKI